MSTIHGFEEIEAWRQARILTNRIYEITCLGEFARDFGLKDQIRRASASIMLNIAEGFERDGNTEFRQFLSLAKGSAGEVRSALYIALDAKLIEMTDFEELQALARKTSRLLSAFIKYLSDTEMRGRKHRDNESH